MNLRNFAWIGIIAVVLIGGFLFRDYLSGNASELKVGDCFDEPADMETVEDVQHHPCSDTHGAEVFYVADYSESDDTAYPSDPEMEAWVTDRCFPAYASYTGRDFLTDPDFGIGWFQPDTAGWEDTQRVTCYLYRLDEAPFKGSQKAG